MRIRTVLLTAAIALIGFTGLSRAATTPVIDVKAALAPRTLGNPKAPVTVDEYASLSCTHCAAFSKETFDKFQAQYIDTGKVFYTYHDFPLNAPALMASMVARCMPASRYFQFTKFLFQTQEKWAFNEHYADALRQNSKLLGFDDATFDACVNNKELKDGLVAQLQDAAKNKKIEATPTFTIDGKDQIAGAMPLSAFQAKIDPLLSVKGNAAK